MWKLSITATIIATRKPLPREDSLGLRPLRPMAAVVTQTFANLNLMFEAVRSTQLMHMHPDNVLWFSYPSIQYLKTPSALGSCFLITGSLQLSATCLKLWSHFFCVFSWSFSWQSSDVASSFWFAITSPK